MHIIMLYIGVVYVSAAMAELSITLFFLHFQTITLLHLFHQSSSPPHTKKDRICFNTLCNVLSKF